MSPERLKVLALSYLFPNQAQLSYGVFVLNRLKAVSSHCDIRVVAPVQWYPLIQKIRGDLWGGEIPRRESIDGVEVHHPRFAVIPKFLKWLDALSYFISARSVTYRLWKEDGFEFDVIDVHWTYPDIVAGWLLARRYGKKFIVTIRGHEALYDREFSLRRLMVRHFLRRAHHVVALSEELREKVIRLGVAADSTSVVLNGVDLAYFECRDTGESRKQLGLSREKRILLSVGRLTAGKGHDVLVRMMSELSKVHDVELYIIGGVNPEDDFGHVLRNMIDAQGLTNVHLVDKLTHRQLSLWYGAADVFCLATKGEGCPNVVLEALACGTPVVVTNVGAVGEVIEPGFNGSLVNLSDVQTFGETVHQALQHPWDRKAIAERMTSWSWGACAEQILDVYRRVLRSERLTVRGTPE